MKPQNFPERKRQRTPGHAGAEAGQPMIDVTNGGIRIEQGADGTDTILISAPAVDMAIAILEDELPWLINTLGDIHRELIADARRVEDAAALDEWSAATSDEMSRNAQQINALRLSRLAAEGEVLT